MEFSSLLKSKKRSHMTKTLRSLLSCTALVPFVLVTVVTSQVVTARVATTNLNIPIQIIHSFNRGSKSDGGGPHAGLVQSSDGYLYGTTGDGGANDQGIIFRIAPNGSGFTPLYSFSGKSGYAPLGRLVEGGDGVSFYGTANYGGLYGQGTVFKFTLDANRKLKEFKTLYSFSTNGEYPNGLVRGKDGNFYGTTIRTFYKISANGAFQTLYKFNNEIGIALGGLLQGKDGRFYGVAGGGGPAGNGQGNGTLYAIPPTPPGQYPTWKPDILYSFYCPTDSIHGCAPSGGVIQDAQGNLYGRTSQGGKFGNGTIFKYTLKARKLDTLHSFSPSEGGGIGTRLLLASDGKLYGTTTLGSSGTVYRISTNGTDDFQVIHSGGTFHFSNELIQGQDGSLYGTTQNGGAYYDGTVYKLDGKALGLKHP